jgi:predicted RNA binding protein YcfA (HicA-like mRNA interferase family)
MPRKKRDIRRDLRKAGFVETKGKGDHTRFRHPLLRKHVVVDGADVASSQVMG